MNSTEGIISAAEAGLGVGFVPCLALEKALKIGSVKAIPLDNGPIRRRELSIVLLNGPEPKGPLRQLLEHLRENASVKQQANVEVRVDDEVAKRVIATNLARAPKHQRGGS